MSAFITVTDSLTGEPVIVNTDRVETIRTRKSMDGTVTTIIDFGRNFVQCTETRAQVVHAIKSAHKGD